MNSEATKLRLRRDEEVKALGGEAQYRLQALQNLKLKAVLKESHAAPVHALAFNHASPNCGNLFATVGADQATIYDDEHMGDYIAINAHFTNQQTEHAQGGELRTLTWLDGTSWSCHPHGDACLAVAGMDPAISVISVVEASVVALLGGHSKEVIDLSSSRACPTLLLSLSRDGNLRLWDVPKETCLTSCILPDAISIAFSCDGQGFVVGTSRGRLVWYDVQTDPQGSTRIVEDSKRELKPAPGTNISSHAEPIDCLRFLSPGRLASKSVDGRMFVWQLPSMECVSGWKVPGCNALTGSSSRCAFNATSDGKYVVAGNATGSCYVFDAEDGKRVAAVSAIRVSAPVRSCALSSDCRHLVAAIGNGFVFRFEYLGKVHNELENDREGDEGNGEALEEKEKENANGNTAARAELMASE